MADEWDQAAEELKSDGPDEWEQAAKAVTSEQRKPDVVTVPNTGFGPAAPIVIGSGEGVGLASRFGKRIADIPANVVHGAISTFTGIPHDLYQQYKTGWDTVPEDSRTSLVAPSKYGEEQAGKVQVAKFNIPEAKNLGETAIDVTAGAAEMLAEIGGIKKAAAKALGVAVAAKIPEHAYWIAQALMTGQNPAVAAAQGKAMGVIEKLPAKSVIEKGVKLLTESGAMYGITRASGGSQEEAAVTAAIPAVMRVPGVVGEAMRPGVEPKPDVVKRAFKQAPEYKETPAVVTAEMAYPATGETPDPSMKAEYDSRMRGEWEAELEAEHRAYENLQNAIGTGDQTKLRRAQTLYDKAKPLSQDFLRQMAEAGDQDAQARLGAGYFMPDDVDTTTPLTAQERSAAKRMGYGKDLTGYKGTMTPGQVRLALRGDQGSVAGARPVETPTVAEAERGKTPSAVEPEKPKTAHPAKQVSTEDKEKRSAFEQDVQFAFERLNSIAKRVRTDDEGRIDLEGSWPHLKTEKSARYFWRDVDTVLHTNLAEDTARVGRESEAIPHEVIGAAKGIIDKSGIDIMADPVFTGESGIALQDALHSGDVSRLTPDQLKAYRLAKDLDEQIGRTSAGLAKWELWKLDREVPGAFKDSPERAKEVFAEGQKAEKDGRLDEWLKTQAWSSRKTYYMSERPKDYARQDLDLLLGERGAPTISGREAMTRTGKTKARHSQNLLLSMLDHWIHLQRFASAAELMDKAGTAMREHKLTPGSEQMVRDYLKNEIAHAAPTYGSIRSWARVNSLFWRMKFLDPRFAERFSIDNVAQQLMMFGQVPLKTLVKGTAQCLKERIGGSRDPERLKEASRIWGPNSRENQQFRLLLRDAQQDWKIEHPDLARAEKKLVSVVESIGEAAGAMDPIMR
jgi:hypothetical protein